MCSLNERMAQAMMPNSNGMSSPLVTAAVALCCLLGAVKPAADGADDLADGEILPAMQLRREADLDVAHALGHVVLGQFARDALQVLGRLQDAAGVDETLQVLRQVLVSALENKLFQAGPLRWRAV